MADVGRMSPSEDPANDEVFRRVSTLDDAELVFALLALHWRLASHLTGEVRREARELAAVIHTVLARFAPDEYERALAMWDGEAEDTSP